MSEGYNPQKIEPKWQQRWEESKLYRSVVDWDRPKHYALTMLPYPSGNLHIGHWFAMSPSDARARFKRMQGYNVLFPMGFDAFGLPAENAAITRNIHPMTWTYDNMDNMRKQLRSMGAMFDWEREAVSCDPSYYKWTEWFFKQFYENGLAYRKEAMVNWSPTLQTVLANEQVMPDGTDERTGQPVIQKMMEQWFFGITRYADELLNFDKLNWPEPIKIMQTNWIGRSEGGNVIFRSEQGDEIEIYTTRPDTLWGATFMVLSPEHALVEKLTTDDQRAEVEAYVEQAARSTEIERTAENREKTGVFTGTYAINPVNKALIPIWIADYVMMTYGTGAIMAVPYGDQRDFEFAKKFGLEIIPVVKPYDADQIPDPDEMEEAYDGPGIMVNSGPIDGLDSNGQKGRKNPAIAATIDWLEENNAGEEAINYRMRDWLISRQRYWGSPIPIIYRHDGELESVPDEDLPVLLPDDVEFVPTGRSPLTYYEPFLYTTDSDGKPARRETDTMDTFMCSSWYQLRYLSPDYDFAPFDPEEAAYWLPVDVYTGGAEHATMHLLYTRFFTKALRDVGIYDDAMDAAAEHGRVPEGMFDEPMTMFRNQGQILGETRPGDWLVAFGTFNDKTLVADRVQVLDVAGTIPVNADAVGELVRRKENILTVEDEDGNQQIVEVPEGAVVDIPSIPGENNVNQLKHHLDIQRMSKTKGNVVDPDTLVAEYGADVVRAYLMFAFKWEQGGPWNSQDIKGIVRFTHDIWNLVTAPLPEDTGEELDAQKVRALRRKVHQTIAKVSDDIESFSFNTAIAALFELKNVMQSMRNTQVIHTEAWDEAVRSLLLLLAPIMPHITEELWAAIGAEYSIHQQSWPEFDAEAAAEDNITLIIQVNGKVRDKIEVPADISEDAARERALASEKVASMLNGGKPKKVIYVPGRLVNVVI